MGDTTSAFANQLNRETTVCGKLLQKRIQADALLERLGPPMLKTSEELQEHVRNHGEELRDDDLVGQELSRKFDDQVEQFSKVQLDQQIAVDQLRTAGRKLKDTLTAFEKYVVAKEKSKNPFKGKKSVPTAKLYIANAKHFMSLVEEMLEV